MVNIPIRYLIKGRLKAHRAISKCGWNGVAIVRRYVRERRGGGEGEEEDLSELAIYYTLIDRRLVIAQIREESRYYSSRYPFEHHVLRRTEYMVLVSPAN